MWYESALAFTMTDAGLAAATKMGNDIQGASAWSLAGYGSFWTCVSDSVKIINAGGGGMEFPAVMGYQTMISAHGGMSWFNLVQEPIYSRMPVDVFDKNRNQGNASITWGDH